RRLRFPKERDVIITDTVGFIRDLPKDLMTAFKSTLEELQDADLLLHLVDISNPRFEQHMESVENILRELNLTDKKRIIVFNKTDKVAEDEIKNIALRYNAIYISALRQSTFNPLLDVIEKNIWDEKLQEIQL
ncbi:MAG: 50S ribosome-binding GTPase, partial [Thermodesulfovibrionales bacterium]|nr:50S ribosome-binding GTPase [Thermodesulfovibrionales bacterium]